MRKQEYKMWGGPLHLHKLYMSSPGTFVFSLNGWKGYYNCSNQWVDVN